MVGRDGDVFAAVGAVAEGGGDPEAELVGEEALQVWEDWWVLDYVVELFVEGCVGEEGAAGEG